MAETDDASLTERQRYWLKHIRACDTAGQTSIDYARAHGINVKSMYSARKALAEKGTLSRPQPSRFQKAQIITGGSTLDSQWRVQLPNGAVVSFDGTVDATALSLVLNTAATVS
jgi:hypothetical protein